MKYMLDTNTCIFAMKQKGIPIGPMDMLIASHAKALGITIVTNNTNEFKRVSGLKLEDWL
ncbi:type II toxin-antitoxin system VapC family toxin [bacterium D16-51]|nr:type II toxin-antitoxin system VapC family toxin [bacterium D16-59]RKI59024.1 type II toxin-antitoxin system VapC family toxin [bacterium D16-51]